MLSACRSRAFEIRSGFPVVAIDIDTTSSRLVTFVGSRSRSETVATRDSTFHWNGSRLVSVEHQASGTKSWPRLTPT
jgi:hypothetical protein